MLSTPAASLEEKSVWYRGYVLIVLLVVSIHCLATRNLPTYLVTVQVPGCENLCKGVDSKPLCGTKKWNNFTGTPTRYATCQMCRAKGGQAFSWGSKQSSNKPGQDAPNEDKEIGEAALVDAEGFKGDADSWLVGGGAMTGNTAFGQEAVFEAELMALSVASKDANYYNMADGACITDWQYGLLIGYGFALVFCIGSIPAGWVLDRRPRVEVATISLVLWSLATAMQATAHQFWDLVACRAIIGLAQAFAMPAAISIGSDVFASKRERLNLAMAVLSVGFYLGSGCASFSIWFSQLIGWRWAVLCAGLVGFALAAILHCTVAEPERTEFTAPCSLTGVRDEVFFKSRVARWCLLAATAKMLAAYVLGSFLPIWYERKDLPGYSNVAYAGFNALIIAAGGLLSTLVGSLLGGHWSKYDSRAPCWIGFIGSVLAIPLVCCVVFIPYFGGSMTSFFVLILIGESWFAPTIALVQKSVRQSHRGQAVPMFLIAVTMGANLGPAIVGLCTLADVGIRTHILWTVIFANCVAAVAFLFTAREITIDPVAAGVGDAEEDFPGNKTGMGMMQWLAPF